MKCCSRSKARLTTGDESIRSYNKNFRVEYLCEVILELRSASSKQETDSSTNYDKNFKKTFLLHF